MAKLPLAIFMSVGMLCFAWSVINEQVGAGVVIICFTLLFGGTMYND